LLVISQVHGAAHTSAVALIPGLAVAGLGMGLVVAPLFDVILASVTDEETGSASGLLNSGQQLSGSIGVAVLGSIFFSAASHGDFHNAFVRTLWVQVGTTVVMVLLTWLMPKHAREPGAELGNAPEPVAVNA
jgi:uncharacterized membrane protein YfcA